MHRLCALMLFLTGCAGTSSTPSDVLVYDASILGVNVGKLEVQLEKDQIDVTFHASRFADIFSETFVHAREIIHHSVPIEYSITVIDDEWITSILLHRATSTTKAIYRDGKVFEFTELPYPVLDPVQLLWCTPLSEGIRFLITRDSVLLAHIAMIEDSTIDVGGTETKSTVWKIVLYNPLQEDEKRISNPSIDGLRKVSTYTVWMSPDGLPLALERELAVSSIHFQLRRLHDE